MTILCQGATGLSFDGDTRGAVAFLTVGDTFEWDVIRYTYDHTATIKELEKRKPPFYENLMKTVRYASNPASIISEAKKRTHAVFRP